MADSIPAPWILDYLIAVAEQYGGRLSIVPQKEKSAKLDAENDDHDQFLTFAPAGSDKPCNIWVEVSDKKHCIRARLTADAIKTYLDDPSHGGKPVTSHKSAFAILKRVSPAFGRVARGDLKGMTEDATLFLDVSEFTLRGAFGEPMWGSPVDIATDPNIREWVEGLRQDGGAGNVLKLRKQQAATLAAEREQLLQQAKITAAQSHIQTALDVKVRVSRKSGPFKPKVPCLADQPNAQRPVADKESLRRASWKRLHTKLNQYLRPPEEIFVQLLNLCGEQTPKAEDTQPQPEQRNRSRPSVDTCTPSPDSQRSLEAYSGGRRSMSQAMGRTRYSSHAFTTELIPPQRSPSHWSESSRGTPPRDEEHDDSSVTEELENDESSDDQDMDVTVDNGIVPPERKSKEEVRCLDTSIDDSTGDLSSPTASIPTPAQPRRPIQQQPPPSSIPHAPSPPHAPVQPLSQRPDNEHGIDVLPPSSMPLSSFQHPSSPTSSPHPPPMSPWSAPALRRVPHPQVFPLRRNSNTSGEGRVLVENSDTASPGSQSQSQSRRQITKESQGHGDSSQSQSQSQRSSNLRNELVVHDEPVRGDGETQSQESQRSHKSRQSLSYNGDSQSQDKTADILPPRASIGPVDEVDEERIRSPSAEPTIFQTGNADAAVQDRFAEGECSTTDAINRPTASTVIHKETLSTLQTTHYATAEPTWEAMNSSEEEDSQNEEVDVDELISSDIGEMQREDSGRAVLAQRSEGMQKGHRRASQKEKGQTVKGNKLIDSDDECTAAMVDGYVSQAGGETQSPAKAQTRDRSTFKRPRLSTPPDIQKPPVKRLKREEHHVSTLLLDADVFTDASSLHNEHPNASTADTSLSREEREPSRAGSDRPSIPSRPAHDGSIWVAPTFMRKQAATELTSVVPFCNVSGRTAGKDITIRMSSPYNSASHSPEREKPRTKKPKTEVPASTTRRLVKRRAESKFVATLDELPHTAATSTTSGSRTQDQVKEISDSTLPIEPSSEAAARSEGIKHVDLRIGSSRLSSGTSRARQTQPLQRSSAGQSSARLATDNAPSLKPSILYNVSGAMDGSSRSDNQRVTVPMPYASSSHSTTGAPGSVSWKSDEAQGSDSVAGISRNFCHFKTPGGPPLLDWKDLLEILLETGRARNEANAHEGNRAAGL